MFKTLKWRREWEQATKSAETLLDRQTNGTTPVSRERQHYKPWVGEAPPDARAHIDFLTAVNPQDLDDFRAMDAVVNWLAEHSWHNLESTGPRAEEVKKEMFARAESVLQDHVTFDDMIKGTPKGRSMQQKRDNEAHRALQKQGEVFAALATAPPEVSSDKRFKYDHNRVANRLSMSTAASSGREPVRAWG